MQTFVSTLLVESLLLLHVVTAAVLYVSCASFLYTQSTLYN